MAKKKKMTKEELDDLFNELCSNLPGEAKTLEQIIKEGEEECRIMAQIDPLVHFIGEA